MNMKRNVLALAISGGLLAAPMAATAGPEVYGLIDIGLESINDSDAASANEIFAGFNSAGGNSDDRDFTLSNAMQSRLGVRGSEDLDYGGLTASYNIEFAVDVLNELGGGMGNSVGTRLGWAAIGGDWGTIKVGSQWQPLFEFGAWNAHRTDVHGYGSYFYTTGLMSNSLAFGFRQSSAISYQYGSAWGHSDPFAFNVTLGIGEGTRTVEDEDGEEMTLANEESISSVAVAGQYSFNQMISVNAVYIKEFNDYADGLGDEEPELINVGARYSVNDALEFGINYTLVDTDNADGDKRDSVAIGSFMDFGNGLDGHLGFATGSDDRDEDTLEGRDLDLNVYGFVRQALSDRTNVRVEFEHARYDGEAGTGASDPSATLVMLALQHNF